LIHPDDSRWMGAALALAQRGVGLARPNPSVGCVLVRDGRVVGRGWTQAGGRPHAEAVALAQAGAQARGATAYVSLEPCAHASPRGPACADGLVAAGVARVVVAAGDPDPRTNGEGVARLRAAGIAVTEGVRSTEAEAGLAGFLSQQRRGRPHITLKLAVSLDGAVALASGQSQWITGDRARAHTHLERARADMILVGHGTFAADAPRLDVRLAGLESRAPIKAVMGRTPVPGWRHLDSPAALAAVTDADLVLAEGGVGLAASLFTADLVDRLLLYRAPIVIGGLTLGDIGLADLAPAHGRWAAQPIVALGADRLETYIRIR
jgi:diaminohydroxyphosphoribosylaminopyrimidine deaminase/5-amino-6-(5-phosphoribosylamino)uracil reductase